MENLFIQILLWRNFSDTREDLVSQHRPDAEGLISILKCLKAKSYVLSLPGRVLAVLPRPSAPRKTLMHFPFETIIEDAKVFYNFRPLSKELNWYGLILEDLGL
jgi:hypothetical protein